MKHTCHICREDKHEDAGEYGHENRTGTVAVYWTCFQCLLRRRAYRSERDPR